MTTLLPRARRSDRGVRPDPRHPGQAPATEHKPDGNWFARHPGWPVSAYLIGYPLWWALGFADFMPVLLAIPVIREMYHWRTRRERTLKVPPGFLIWAFFLVVMVIGIVALGQTAPQTIVSSTSNRLISYALRAADYGGVTLMLLYAGNLTEAELPRRKLAWLLGLVGIYATIGGLLGMADPTFSFSSPLSYLVPQSLQNNNAQLAVLLHPGSSEIQNLLGYAEGRPKAPFDYTNMWGECLAILLPWLIVAWWSHGTRRHRQAVVAVLVIAMAPILYSLDRGLWLGIACSLVYLAVRYAARGKLGMLGALAAAIALAGIVIIASPVGNLISSRLQHGKSNAVRTSLSGIAIQDANSSPFIGYGDTRHEQGSTNSIAVGRTTKCKSCGSRSIGGNGQLWLLFVTNGYLGAGLYLGFFGYGVWRYRRDKTPYGMVGVLVLLLGFVFMVSYEAVGPPLTFTVLAYVLLWRNDIEMRRESADPGRPAAGPAGPGWPVGGIDGGPRVLTAGESA